MYKLVPLGKKLLIFLAEAVPILFNPSAIRLSQLSEQVTHELTLVSKLPTEVAYFVFGVERRSPQDASCCTVLVSMRSSARAWLLACAAAIIRFAASFS